MRSDGRLQRKYSKEEDVNIRSGSVKDKNLGRVRGCLRGNDFYVCQLCRQSLFLVFWAEIL